MPHSPNTTDGTTATRSVSETSDCFSHAGATCVVNRAMPRLTGTRDDDGDQRRDRGAVDEASAP